jgi:CHAT domain-containing protein
MLRDQPYLKVFPGARARAIALFGVSLFIALTSLPKSNAQDTPTLEPGNPLKRELKAGETHHYAVTLPAGQHLRIEVEQFGFRLGLKLLAPNRANLLDFSALISGGKQRAFLVAEQTGSYELQLHAVNDESKPTRYIIQTSELRVATERDRERLAVQNAYQAAYQLGRPTAAAAVRESLNQFEAALLLSQKIGEPEMEALILHELGWRYSFDANNEAKALECFSRALQLRRALGQKPEQASELTCLGYSHYMLGQLAQAREYYQQALLLLREVGNQGDEGGVLYKLGLTYLRESLARTATYYQQAELLLHTAGEIEAETMIEYELALAWLFLGEPQQAFAASAKALALAERLSLKVHQGNALLNLARTHLAVGDYQQTLNTAYQALAIFQAWQNSIGEAVVYHILASQFLELGEAQRAVEFYQQSIGLHQKLGYEARALRAQVELAHSYCQLGQYQTARDYALSILPLARKYQDKVSEGRALEALGQAYQALREYQKSGESYGQAAVLFQAVPFPAGEVRVIYANGQTYAARRDFPKALEQFRQARAFAQKLSNPLIEAQSLASIAQVERELGRVTEARTQLEAALALIESVRSRVASPALRASFLATQHSSYETYLDLLMQLDRQEPKAGHAASALQIAERARARSLTEILAEAPANIREGVAPALLARERELRQRLSAKSSAQNRAASLSEEQAAVFSRELSELTAELEQVEAQIRAASPRYAALTKPQPLSLTEIQQSVVSDADTLLLEYALGEERSFLWAITKDSFTSYELPARAVIEGEARRVYALLTARNQRPKFEEDAQRRARLAQADAAFPAAAAKLSQLILAPAAAKLGKRRLLIVADGALQYVPFAALPECGMRNAECGMTKQIRNSPSANRNFQPLIVNHEIANLPSASALAVLRREVAGRTPAPQTVAVLADPVFQKEDERVRAALAGSNAGADLAKPASGAATPKPPAAWLNELERAARGVDESERAGFDRLPATRAEAQAAVKFAPAGTSRIALDFAANQTTATGGELSQYRYVHFATHGLLNSEHPELSGLVLSLVDEMGQEADGFLPLLEIYNLKLPAELVVLSACKTGLGKEVRGEGLLSLTRGFMHAGAARVLVSLWGVNDRSTAALMAQLYQRMLQERLAPAAALRQAQLALRQNRQWAAPYYWAAFALHGEPR